MDTISRGRMEGLYWSQPGSEEAQPLQLSLLSSLGEPLLVMAHDGNIWINTE